MQAAPQRTLPEVGFAAKLSKEDRIELGKCGWYYTFSKGERILTTGKEHHWLHLVVEGELVAARTLPDGTRKIFTEIKRGETFGEINLFDPQGATSDVLGEVPDTIWRLDWEELKKFLLLKKPEIILDVMQAISCQLARRVRKHSQHLQNIPFAEG